MQRLSGLKSVNQPAVPPETRFTSYSANFEDVILHRLFVDNVSGFYVDVGAGHPCFANDTMALYAEGWNGINVEPSSHFHKLLCERRDRDKNLSVLLGEQLGTATLYEILGTGISTCVRASAEQARQDGYSVVESEVAVRTLEDVLLSEARQSAIDLLRIAVEGWEAQVLKGNDWQRYRPSIILLRANRSNLGEDSLGVQKYLEERDYAYAYFDGVNEFYVERGFSVPKGAFSVPTNVRDGFKLHHVAQLEQSLLSAHLNIADLQADRFRLTTATERMRRELMSAADELEQAHKDREALIKYRTRWPLAPIRSFALHCGLLAARAARYVARLTKKPLRLGEHRRS